MHLQLAGLRTSRLFPGQLVGCGRPVATRSAIAVDLAADRRSRPAKYLRYCPERSTFNDAPRDLFTLRPTQRSHRAPSGGRLDAPGRANMRKNTRMPPAQRPTDRSYTFAIPPALPKLR